MGVLKTGPKRKNCIISIYISFPEKICLCAYNWILIYSEIEVLWLNIMPCLHIRFASFSKRHRRTFCITWGIIKISKTIVFNKIKIYRSFLIIVAWIHLQLIRM